MLFLFQGQSQSGGHGPGGGKKDDKVRGAVCRAGLPVPPRVWRCLEVPCAAWHCVARGAQRAAVSCTASRSCRDEDVSKVSGLVLLSCGVVRVPAPCVLYSMKNGRDLH